MIMFYFLIILQALNIGLWKWSPINQHNCRFTPINSIYTISYLRQLAKILYIVANNLKQKTKNKTKQNLNHITNEETNEPNNISTLSCFVHIQSQDSSIDNHLQAMNNPTVLTMDFFLLHLTIQCFALSIQKKKSLLYL